MSEYTLNPINPIRHLFPDSFLLHAFPGTVNEVRRRCSASVRSRALNGFHIQWIGSRVHGLHIAPIMENQVQKNMENEMESKIIA